MDLPDGVINNINQAFEHTLNYGRAVAGNPYIHLKRVTITGGDSTLGIDPTEIDNSVYFLEADMDRVSVKEESLLYRTSIIESSEYIFYVDYNPIYLTDDVHYFPEANIDLHVYGDVIKSSTAKFVSYGIKQNDTIKLYDMPLTGGYIYNNEYIIQSIDSETQLTLTTSVGVTGVTMAYTIGSPQVFDITEIHPNKEYGYTMVMAIKQQT